MMAASAPPSAVICGGRGPPPRIAVCIAGAPVIGALHSSFRSIRDNVLHALCGNATTAFAYLVLNEGTSSTQMQQSSEAAAQYAVERYLRPARHKLVVGSSSSSSSLERTSQRGCLMDLVATHEREQQQQLGLLARFDSVLMLPADVVWVVPMWPWCLQPVSADRRAGRVRWLARQKADAIFFSQSVTIIADGSSGDSDDDDPQLRATVALLPGGRLDCTQWSMAIAPAYSAEAMVGVANGSSAPRCPEYLINESGAIAASNADAASDDDASSELEQPEHDHLTARHVCAGDHHRPAPSIALCIGGLARTFAHALVHTTLLHHLAKPLGARRLAVFAHLRLDDKRGLTTMFGKDFSGTVSTTRAGVTRALLEMGADMEHDVILLDKAEVDPPKCNGRGGVYDRVDDRTSQQKEKNVCKGYGLACSQHVVDGMLMTRMALYDLVLQHEERRHRRHLFSSLLFVRPDLVALLPSRPWCLHALHIPRKNQDWLEWLPRKDADILWRVIPRQYFGCLLPNFTLFERDYSSEARRYGTYLVQDPSLRVNAIVRENRPNFPNKKDCGELAEGFKAVAPRYARPPPTTSARNATRRLSTIAELVAQSSPALKHCTRCPLTACSQLTYANPSNVVESR